MNAWSVYVSGYCFFGVFVWSDDDIDGIFQNGGGVDVALLLKIEDIFFALKMVIDDFGFGEGEVEGA